MAFQQSATDEKCIKSKGMPHIHPHGSPASASPLRSGNIPPEIHILYDNIERLQNRLFPEEMDIIRNSVEKRQREFTAGRTLARRAFSSFGIDSQPILQEKRMPVWPAAVTGSISHCNTHCAVAAGLRSQFLSIGLDIETAGMVTPDLWDHTFTARERDDIAAAPQVRQEFLATAMFSAKESFFKLQYPLTGKWVGFEEAFVEIPDDNCFRITCSKPAGIIPLTLHGAIMRPLPGLVLSILWIPAIR